MQYFAGWCMKTRTRAEDVRLDIVIPKGYDKSVLKNVEKYAKDKAVKINILKSE